MAPPRRIHTRGAVAPVVSTNTSIRVLVFHLIALVAVAGLFAFNVREHVFLTDDSYISFRYAEHLAQGHGLVWNPGERVEGYTNFLWVILMAAATRLGMRPELASIGLGVASGAVVLAGLVAFAAGRSSWRSPFIWVAPLGLAASRSFTAWCTGGLETMFFTLLVFGGYLTFLAEHRRGSSLPVGSSLLFALASLTRPEGALFMFVAGAFYSSQILMRKRSLKSGLLWAFPYVGIVGAHALWRLSYYGFWLPNSFYAKVAGTWWDQGLRYLSLFAEDYAILWFLPLVIVPLVLSRERFAPALFLTAIATYLLYVTSVGGDRFEFRFLVVVFPYFYGLLADAVARIAELGRWSWRGVNPMVIVSGALAGTLLLTTHVVSQRPERELERHGVASLRLIEGYATRRAAEGRFLRQLIDQGLLSKEIVLCVSGAGAVPFYTGWPTVDGLGINDVVIARSPVSGQRGTVGHERLVSLDYLRERQVVILDAFNRLVYDNQDWRRLPRTVEYAGRVLPVRVVQAADRTLVFVTVCTEQEFRRLFAGLQIVR